ncbi:hypothetical protein Bca52824_007202 [Brassica carinata]|uniref:DUF659 domain-containing protein n=1 Tax=Brassica carinata TaxID=52824 RepID=A0A8X8B566_BRACI|nr:hypothetical protein Bca52824_007202 [Brassica carinata]
MVHLVTDSAPNYKAAGRLLSEKFPTIAWSPCAAHCINLILVGKLPMVLDLVKRISKVTIFVYNHKWPLSFLRKIPGWREHPSGRNSFCYQFHCSTKSLPA